MLRIPVVSAPTLWELFGGAEGNGPAAGFQGTGGGGTLPGTGTMGSGGPD